jgi:hypothetical protein
MSINETKALNDYSCQRQSLWITFTLIGLFGIFGFYEAYQGRWMGYVFIIFWAVIIGIILFNWFAWSLLIFFAIFVLPLQLFFAVFETGKIAIKNADLKSELYLKYGVKEA